MVDVLIITALQSEFDAAYEASLRRSAGAEGVSTWREQGTGDTQPFLQGDYAVSDGTTITLALARPTRIGPVPTSAIASSLAERLKPRCLAMCGVCAGNPAHVLLGDVIIAEMVYDYGEGALTDGGFVPNSRQDRMPDPWLRAAQELKPSGLPSFRDPSETAAGEWILECLLHDQDPAAHRARYFVSNESWSKQIGALERDGLVGWRTGRLALTKKGEREAHKLLYRQLGAPPTLPFAIKVGSMVTGSGVVKNRDAWKDLGHVFGRDMEAASIGTAARIRGISHWIVAKGVMDYAHVSKNDHYKSFAARASAEVLFRFLSRHVRPKPPTLDTAAGYALVLRCIREGKTLEQTLVITRPTGLPDHWVIDVYNAETGRKGR